MLKCFRADCLVTTTLPFSIHFPIKTGQKREKAAISYVSVSLYNLAKVQA